jgi:hypothetical protein
VPKARIELLGGFLARQGSGRGGEQPPPGRPRRQARLGADAIELRDALLLLDVDVDVEEFERAAGDARRAGMPAGYRHALSLYGGELLPENRYEDWVHGGDGLA